MNRKEPKRQFNIRIKKTLLREIEEEAAKHGVNRSQYFIAMLEKQVREMCRPCKGKGKRYPNDPLDTRVCPKCDGYGKKRRHVKAMVEAAKNAGQAARETA